MELVMKTIIVVLMSLSVCGSVYAGQGDVYLKAGAAYLDVSSDFDVKYENYFMEDLGGGTILEEYIVGSANGDVDGDGFLVELGVGYEITRSLFVEGSLGYGKVDLSADELSFHEDAVTLINGSVVDTTSDSFVAPVRTEVEISTIVGMVDANYVFTDIFMSEESPFSAFVGLGVGFADNTISDSITLVEDAESGTIKGKATIGLAWRINVGAEYALSEHWAANLTYRYMDLGVAEGEQSLVAADPAEFTENPEFDLTAHAFYVGVSYRF